MKILFTHFRTAWGMVFVAVTELGLAATQLGGGQAEWAAALRRRFPGADLRPGDSRELRNAQRQVREYLDGRRKTFRLQIDGRGLSAFQGRVLRAVSSIPYGETRTYGEVAKAAGCAGAARAAGGAVGANPFAPVIPCHRVVSAAGGLGGYSGAGGGRTKKKLLDMERRTKPPRSRRLKS
jgi:methylated-DNA-[protein]-cysteine S-methyltransferase